MANGKVQTVAGAYYVGGEFRYIRADGTLSDRRNVSHESISVPAADMGKLLAVLDTRAGSVEVWPVERAAADRTGGARPAADLPTAVPDDTPTIPAGGVVTPVVAVAVAYYPSGGNGAWCYLDAAGGFSGTPVRLTPDVARTAALACLDRHNGSVEVWPVERATVATASEESITLTVDGPADKPAAGDTAPRGRRTRTVG